MLLRIIVLSLFFLSFIRAQKFSSTWYTTDNGLPQNSVKDIVKDKYGFIWIATEKGVLRYDGQNFITYYDLEINNFHFKTFTGSIEKDSITIFNDRNQNGLLIRNRKPLEITPGKFPEGEYIDGTYYPYYWKRAWIESKNDAGYVIRMSTGKYLITRNHIVYYRKNQPVRSIGLEVDPRNMNGVFVIGETLFIRSSKQRMLTAITQGKDEVVRNGLFTDPESMIYWEQVNRQVFIIRHHQIYLVSYRNRQLTVKKILDYPGFANERFYAMFYDREFGNLYLGSLYKGLQIIRPRHFSCVRNTIPYQISQFNTLLPYSARTVITQDGSVFGSTAKTADLGFDQKNNYNSMLYDHSGNVVCFRDHRIFRYSRSSLFKKRKEIILDLDNIRHVFRSANRYFVSGSKKGIHFLIEFTSSDYSVEKTRFLMNSAPDCVRRYSHDILLIGCPDGLYMLRNGKPLPEKIPGISNTRNICRSRDGRFWFMTYSDGIFLLKDRQFIPVPPDEQHHLDTSHDLLEDSLGFLWISTNNGLYKIRRDFLFTSMSARQSRVYYYRYATRDGFNSNEFNGTGRPGACRLPGGEFVFPSMDGLVFFTPEQTPSLYPDPKSITVERLKMNERTLLFHKAFTLPRDFKRAEIFIDVPYYAHPENLVIETAMDQDTIGNWSRMGDAKSILIDEEIAPGNHVLKVRVLTGNDGVYTCKKIQFYVTPYFYQTIWFRGIVVASIAVLMVLLIKTITRRLYETVDRQKKTIRSVKEKLEQTQDKLKNETGYQEGLLQAITHDIATPIKHLSNLAQMMLENENPDQQRKYFDSVYQSTEELYNLTISFREYRQAFNGDQLSVADYPLRDVAQAKVKLFSDMAHYRNTEIINHIPESLQTQINPNIIGIIFQNLIDNAVKHTMNGTIALHAYSHNHDIVITLIDDGKGMTESQLDYYNSLYRSESEKNLVFKNFGLGLHLVIRLIKKLNAQIEFNKNFNQGTVITIKLINAYVQKNTHC